LSGFLAGIFGIGGGAILVPVFYECFRLAGVPLEVRMPLCIGTSLAIIIPTSISSFRAHYARGAVDMEILKRCGFRSWSRDRRQRHGTLRAGAAVQDRVRMCRVVGCDAAFSGARPLEIRRGRSHRPLDAVLRLLHRPALDADGGWRRPVRQSADDLLRPPDSSGGGDVIGARGADLDPRCARYVYAGWPAAAHFPQVAALQVPFAIGYVSLIGALLVMPTSLLTAPLGVRAAHAMSKRRLEIAFGVYLFIVGGRFVISLINGQ